MVIGSTSTIEITESEALRGKLRELRENGDAHRHPEEDPCVAYCLDRDLQRFPMEKSPTSLTNSLRIEKSIMQGELPLFRSRPLWATCKSTTRSLLCWRYETRDVRIIVHTTSADRMIAFDYPRLIGIRGLSLIWRRFLVFQRGL